MLYHSWIYFTDKWVSETISTKCARIMLNAYIFLWFLKHLSSWIVDSLIYCKGIDHTNDIFFKNISVTWEMNCAWSEYAVCIGHEQSLKRFTISKQNVYSIDYSLSEPVIQLIACLNTIIIANYMEAKLVAYTQKLKWSVSRNICVQFCSALFCCAYTTRAPFY